MRFACRLGDEGSDDDITDNRDYFRARAIEEHTKAENAETPIAAEVHEALAKRYENLAVRDESVSENEDTPNSSVQRLPAGKNTIFRHEGMVAKE